MVQALYPFPLGVYLPLADVLGLYRLVVNYVLPLEQLVKSVCQLVHPIDLDHVVFLELLYLLLELQAVFLLLVLFLLYSEVFDLLLHLVDDLLVGPEV